MAAEVIYVWKRGKCPISGGLIAIGENYCFPTMD